jgi:hypothetical protein
VSPPLPLSRRPPIRAGLLLTIPSWKIFYLPITKTKRDHTLVERFENMF